MTHRLRRRHRAFAIALAVLVPPAFAAALAARPAPPERGTLPPPLLALPASGAEQWAREDLWGPLAIRTRGFAPAEGGGPVLELVPARDLLRPSLLVYWAATGAADALPPGAHLVGRLAGVEARRFALPAAALGTPGRLYLYSLGHHELLGSAALPAPDAPAARR
jgi:hypothetical protein